MILQLEIILGSEGETILFKPYTLDIQKMYLFIDFVYLQNSSKL